MDAVTKCGHAELPMTALAWSEERHANTLRLAAEKTGSDRDGWLEDARYWELIIADLRLAAFPHAEAPPTPDWEPDVCEFCGEHEGDTPRFIVVCSACWNKNAANLLALRVIAADLRVIAADLRAMCVNTATDCRDRCVTYRCQTCAAADQLDTLAASAEPMSR